MKTEQFKVFLKAGGHTDKSVTYRASKAVKAEALLKMSLDSVVSDDALMKAGLLMLKGNEGKAHGNLQNALRHYYRFANHRSFPRLKDA